MHIVLVTPEIPPNTGNIIRLAANTGCDLHLIEPLGFTLEDKHMRRAGLDYHEYASVKCHASWEVFLASERPDPTHMYAITTKGKRLYSEVKWTYADWIVFGCETKGLPENVRAFFADEQKIRLPMLPTQRSLNLSNSVAIAVYEAWRQNNFVEGV